MSRDGLLPRGLAAVNEKRGTPAKITIGVGVAVALIAGWAGDVRRGGDRSKAAGPADGGSSPAPGGNDAHTR